jgi:hypothetical protein
MHMNIYNRSITSRTLSPCNSLRTVPSTMRPAAAGAARPLSAVYNANVAGDVPDKVLMAVQQPAQQYVATTG